MWFCKLTSPPEIGHAKIEEVTDNSEKHIVQYIIRVCTTQNEAYTINIYLTTSRLLVNGKNAPLFLYNKLELKNE